MYHIALCLLVKFEHIALIIKQGTDKNITNILTKFSGNKIYESSSNYLIKQLGAEYVDPKLGMSLFRLSSVALLFWPRIAKIWRNTRV